MRRLTLLTLPLALITLLSLTGCSWMPFFGDDEEPESETAGYTEKDFYNVIQRNLNARNWKLAIDNLQALEAQFPFGTYAEQAQLELIYAQYRSADYEAAIAAADRFIRLHPRHPNVDYAYYLKGLSLLSQSNSFFDNFLPTDQTARDPGSARESFAAFSELLARFPNSSYAADARKRMIHLRNLLARYEINVANYYFKRKAYVAAANRGRYVVENFQQTPSVPDGLAIMAEAYHLLGLQELSADAVQVLAANYPDYPALDANGVFTYQGVSEDESRGWIKSLTLGLYDNAQPPHYDTRAQYNPAQYKDEDKGPKRSWLNRLTFGLLGKG
ncbi:MAG: outer membrane protein assembly factor BamD [Porticoccaceae bacterium]|nr:outer membrane protein assembly factor BamD [Porticoccaceae bacterium]